MESDEMIEEQPAERTRFLWITISLRTRARARHLYLCTNVNYTLCNGRVKLATNNNSQQRAIARRKRIPPDLSFALKHNHID